MLGRHSAGLAPRPVRNPDLVQDGSGPDLASFSGFLGMIEIENGAQKNLLKSVHDAAWYFAENEFGSENSMVEIENGAHNLLKSVHDAA